MITVYDKGRIKLDLDILDILGIPNPTLDPELGEAKAVDYQTIRLRLIWTWIKDNSILVALIVLGVFFGVLWLRKE